MQTLTWFLITWILLPSMSWGDFLFKDRADLEKFLNDRLSMYTPDGLNVSYGLSPRKAIKNIELWYNGYYRVDFKSKKDGLKYSCDVDRVAQGGVRQGIYVFNCKNEKDSSIFPTELKRVFLEKFPSKADPDSITVARSLGESVANSIAMFDDFTYSVEYDSPDHLQTNRCQAVLKLQLRPHSLVDQDLALTNCLSFAKKPDPKVLQQEKSCTLHNNPVVSIADLPGLFYNQLDKELSKQWPLPKALDCSGNPFHLYDQAKREADKMIDTDRIRLKSNTFEKQEIEKIALRNALIVQAYDRLYVHSLNDRRQSPLNWLSVATHSSALVGKSLRHGAADDDSKVGGWAGVEQGDKSYLDNSSPIAKAILESNMVKKEIGLGNQRVFEDMFWQNLVAGYCGPKKMAEIADYARQIEPDKAQHFKSLANAWSQIAAGTESKPRNEKQIQMGNAQLLWIEQHDILQPIMYKGWVNKIVHGTGMFNSLARTNFSDPNQSPLQTFSQYARQKNISEDLSNFDSRFEWMKYVIQNQSEYVRTTALKGEAKTVFMPPLFEASEILREYTVKENSKSEDELNALSGRPLQGF